MFKKNSNEMLPFTCCWCHEKTLEVRVFNGLYYHSGDCLQAAITRNRLQEYDAEFDGPDETVEPEEK